jgi:hypothetical protein
MQNGMGIPFVDADGNMVLKYKTPKYYYHNCEEYRERMKMKMRENYHKKKAENSEFDKERTKTRNKARYHEDPEYREKQKAANKARYHAKKQTRLDTIL